MRQYTRVIRHTFDGEIGSVTFLSNSWVKFIYRGDVYILPLSLPLSNSEGRTVHHPDNWKYSTIGDWLVSVAWRYNVLQQGSL